MHKKLLAVAVAGALAAPTVAMAQVTISGALNMWYESAGATGATNQTTAASTVTTFDVKARDRMQDGAGSNIRFAAVEDIGGGLQAFGQVESAVLSNGNTRPDAAGTAAGSTGGWATRNSGVGLRGAAWGEFLIGIWDVHYNETYAVDNQILKGAAHNSSLGMLNSFGTVGFAGTAVGSLGAASIGGRYSNVIRYQSPNWSGFNFRASYARPSDGAVSTTTTAAGNVQEGKKNKAINFVPAYSNGPIYVSWSYLKDSDINTATSTTYTSATGGPTVGATLYTITSSRLAGAYTFPFGLKLGLIVDASKLEGKATAPTAGTELKKTAWSFPVSWNTGAHTIFATYAVASKLKGSINGADLSTFSITPSGTGAVAQTMDSNTGAKFYSLGYQFDLSKRTNVHVSYTMIKNESLAGYDFFSNTSGMGGSNFGADPKIMSLGLRHAF